MALPGDYAIVDATDGRASIGKVLVMVDDELTAREIAAELDQRVVGSSRALQPPPGIRGAAPSGR